MASKHTAIPFHLTSKDWQRWLSAAAIEQITKKRISSRAITCRLSVSVEDNPFSHCSAWWFPIINPTSWGNLGARHTVKKMFYDPYNLINHSSMDRGRMYSTLHIFARRTKAILCICSQQSLNCGCHEYNARIYSCQIYHHWDKVKIAAFLPGRPFYGCKFWASSYCYRLQAMMACLFQFQGIDKNEDVCCSSLRSTIFQIWLLSCSMIAAL